MRARKLFIRDMGHKPGEPLPSSDLVFFQCVRCWTILESNPSVSDRCTCGNVSVDVDYSRAGARDEMLLRLLKIVKHAQ